MTNDSESKALKHWFDKAAAHKLAAQLANALPSFERAKYVRLATRGLDKLEFSARVQQFADAMRPTLPQSVPVALDTLTRSLPDSLPDCETVTDGWLQWPIGQFIADNGLDHFDESMLAMIELTKRLTSEFAVRPFVERFPERTIRRLLELTSDPNPHVRRWCSEAVRPRLPWGKKLRALVRDPAPIFPILEKLKDDPELYVRRSVANNLNDIAKDHPETVVQKCKAWAKGCGEDRDWVIKHGLRSLIKDGLPAALAVVGIGSPKKLNATLTVQPSRISIGDEVELSAQINTTHARSQELLIDYVVHYVRQRGKVSAKVFKWTTMKLLSRGGASLTKKHKMKTTSVRALYPGDHRVELQINGVRVAESSFRLQ
jgi:3-methyladenine DNA glycosylase AlkC